MNKIFSFAFLTLTLIFVVSGNIRTARTSSGQNEDNGINAIKQCNETYQIKSEYLQDLNDTGSFSDETEKTPMCFIKCYLEKMKIINDKGEINNEVATAMYQIENDQTIESCNNEMTSASINDACGKAYYFVRCIMTASIIDRKENSDEEKA